MATHKIFDRAIGSKQFEVWVTDGLVQYVVDGNIRHDLEFVSDFLSAAARQINKPNATDPTIVERDGAIDDRALENFEGGNGSTLDTGGTSPTISLQDDGTQIKISNGGVSGSYVVDFGTGSNGMNEAAKFLDFAEDLLGKATTTDQAVLTGIVMGDNTRTVTVSTRDDDIHEIKYKSTGDRKDLSWADAFVDWLGAENGGTKTRDGNVSDTGYTAQQLKFGETGGEQDKTKVDLGSNGVGGKELWQFNSEDDAQAFFDAVEDAFNGSRSDIVNSAVEAIAEELGGTQVRDGNVSTNYQAKQIKLVGDKTMVDLGSHGVGGKEQYDFDDQATAQKFIDTIRDAFGLEAVEGKIIDEYIYKISGGSGLSGSPTLVGKDAMIEFIAFDQFDADRKRDGSVSESFDGSSKIIGDGTEVQLGPRGVGGKEIWDFDTAQEAMTFVNTLDELFG